MSSTFSDDETAHFFGFLDAATALVFVCKQFDRFTHQFQSKVIISVKSGVDGCDEAWDGDEVYCSGGHDWCGVFTVWLSLLIISIGINPKLL